MLSPCVRPSFSHRAIWQYWLDKTDTVTHSDTSHVIGARSDSFTALSTLVLSWGQCGTLMWSPSRPHPGGNKEKKESLVLNIFHYWQNFFSAQKVRTITKVFILFLNLRKNQSTLLRQNYSLDMGKCFLTNFFNFNPPTTTRSSVI